MLSQYFIEITENSHKFTIFLQVLFSPLPGCYKVKPDLLVANQMLLYNIRLYFKPFLISRP